VGRHTVPGTGTPEPDRGFWIRIAVAVVAVLLVGGYFLTRGGGDDQVGTATGPTSTPSATSSGTSSGSGSSSSPAPATTVGSPTPSPTKTARPPTLAFTVRYPAYITVRVPGGRTLVSKLFKSGATASYDQKVLTVVNGRPQAVRFVVNGKPRKPGPSGQTEVFTVRRS
jgi:RodZ C-terminal domain